MTQLNKPLTIENKLIQKFNLQHGKILNHLSIIKQQQMNFVNIDNSIIFTIIAEYI